MQRLPHDMEQCFHSLTTQGFYLEMARASGQSRSGLPHKTLDNIGAVSYTHLRAHETLSDL
eukprot:2869127-Karenia_brevis.AAC.1